MIEFLSWDSDFFGFKVGKASFTNLVQTGDKESIEIAKGEGYRLVYLGLELPLVEPFFIPGEFIDFAEKIKARHVDTKVWFSQKIISEARPEALEEVHLWKPGEPIEPFYALAFQSGVFSRFKLDKELPSGSFERLYKIWIDNSINGEMADFFVFTKEEERISGFITLKLREKYGTVGLLAVDENYRGKQIAQKLMEAAKTLTVKEGINEIRVATQLQNQPACNFYRKNGYQLIQATAIWHWWIKNQSI